MGLWLCEHGRRRRQSDECGSAKHGRQRYLCKDCGGKGTLSAVVVRRHERAEATQRVQGVRKSAPEFACSCRDPTNLLPFGLKSQPSGGRPRARHMPR